MLLIGFKNPKLKPLTGKTLAEVAKMRGKSPEETAMDLVIEDDSRVGTVYFLMSEDNVRREVGLPWMSFGSDEASEAPEGVFLKSSSHPRAYGNFARVLGKYVARREGREPGGRDPPPDLAARDQPRHPQRGWLAPGYYGDVVVFDPATIQDHATFEKPKQLATGVDDVFVNGVQVLRTASTPAPSPAGSSAAPAGPAGPAAALATSHRPLAPIGPRAMIEFTIFFCGIGGSGMLPLASIVRAGGAQGRRLRPLARRRARRRPSSTICARSASSCFRRTARACSRG